MTDTAEVDTVPLNKLAKVYRRIREEIATITQEYDNKVEALKAQQEALKIAMKDQMKAMGVMSVRTNEGTVVLSVKTVYDTNDWDSFKSFVVQNDALDLLQKRISQTNMKQFLEENPGLVPPGLNSRSEFDVSVRKS